MTRHPTTNDLRRALAAICATPEQQALVAEALPGHGRKASDYDGEQKETKPRVPIIGVDSGAMPGTRPDHLY